MMIVYINNFFRNKAERKSAQKRIGCGRTAHFTLSEIKSLTDDLIAAPCAVSSV